MKITIEAHDFHNLPGSCANPTVMSHPRVEELSDSDPSEADPADFLPPPSSLRARPSSQQNPAQGHHSQPQPGPQFRNANPSSAQAELHKTYQCLYPIYFDANRTRAEGRRVGREQAVENPLARTIVDAVGGLGLDIVFEPAKLHPKDWGNPGRIRVGLKGNRARIKNKHHLYLLVSAYLRSHPTTPESPLRLRIQGMPMPEKELSPPAVPRGWKLNTILPLHSPALSGGGVSENILKDMMNEMQAQGGGMVDGTGISGSSGGGGGGTATRKKGKGKKG
ncbi:MAG: hypothetical protein LQ342_006080 [Letrouitia transgressa]|nr:MAG: hypothetical protein LQ342_006080 [Letrouitia transgressa]